jgi:hypothetical protein
MFKGSFQNTQRETLQGQHGTATENIVENISEAMSMAKGYSKYVKFQELNLDTVLSALQYRSMMKSCFGHEQILLASSVQDPLDSNSVKFHNVTDKLPEAMRHKMLAKIPNVTRSFEELYMREPIPGSQERQCAQGTQCECRFIDPMKPFIAVEFLTLEQLNGTPLSHPQLCVICSRKQTQFLYYDMVFNKCIYNTVIQRYGNLSGPGEYAPECLLKCTRNCDISCMPKPIMSHQRNRYVVYYDEDQAIHFLRQVRVSPGDHIPSTPGVSAERVNTTCQLLSASTSSGSSCMTDKSGKHMINQYTGIQRPGKGRGF